MSYEAVLFDNDGVLIERHRTGTIQQQIRELLADHGAEPDEDQLHALTWATGRRAIERTCQQLGVDPEGFWSQRERTCSRVQQEAIRAGDKDLYPDIDAVHELAEERPLGIVSNNQQETIDFIIDYFEMQETFATHYGREPGLKGVSRKKPAPYYLRLAQQDIGASPEDVLFIGDSTSDIEAAHNAGMDAAFIRRPHREGYDVREPPEHEINGLRALLELV